MKILYLEDNKLDIELTRREFSKIAPDFAMEVVNTVKSAQNQLLEEMAVPYDIVLTDMHLPDGDGLNFMEWVREKNYPCAVVLITGHGDEEIAVTALKSGADDYIAKAPGYIERLPRVLEGAVQRHRDEIARKTRILNVLYVEHNSVDIDLTRRHLARYAPHLHLETLGTSQEVIQLLSEPDMRHRYDVVLLDHRLHGLNAIEVLKELQAYKLTIPIILVTGHGDEEIAVQALKLGAADYVVKSSDYLFHLPSVIENAYNRFQLQVEQEALRSSEERFRRLTENAQDIISRVVTTPRIKFEYMSPAVMNVLGYTPKEFYQNDEIYRQFVLPEYLEQIAGFAEDLEKIPNPLILQMRHKDGQIVWVEVRSVLVYDDRQQLVAVESVTRDITDRKKAEERIHLQMERISTMLTIDNAISASLDLNLTLTIVLEHVVSQLKVDAASVLLLDPYTQTLKFFAGRGFHSDIARNFNMRVGEGFPGQAILERRIVFSINPADFANPEYFTLEMIKEKFSSAYWVPLISKGAVKAVMEVFSRKTIDADRDWMDYLTMLSSQTAIAIDNAELFERLQHSNEELVQAYDSTLEGWVHALDLRDKETEGHSKRVAEVTILLATRMGVRPADMEQLRRGALLHDIGKMGVPDAILLKNGPLTDEEWKVMRKHPEFAAELLKPIGYLRKALEIPLFHHERWDGTGYPHGLRGNEIPLSARIFAVIDVWDALTSHRPYRAAWSHADAAKYIQEQSGKQFDPHVTSEFLGLLNERII